MSNIKKGNLVRYIGDNKIERPNAYGWIGKAVSAGLHKDGGYWVVEPPMPGGTIFYRGNAYAAECVFARVLAPIRDQPGNESFVVEARKKLPRTKDTPATINERGELV